MWYERHCLGCLMCIRSPSKGKPRCENLPLLETTLPAEQVMPEFGEIRVLACKGPPYLLGKSQSKWDGTHVARVGRDRAHLPHVWPSGQNAAKHFLIFSGLVHAAWIDTTPDDFYWNYPSNCFCKNINCDLYKLSVKRPAGSSEFKRKWSWMDAPEPRKGNKKPRAGRLLGNANGSR